MYDVRDKKAPNGASPVLALLGHVIKLEQKTLLAIVKSYIPSRTAAFGFGLAHNQQEVIRRA